MHRSYLPERLRLRVRASLRPGSSFKTFSGPLLLLQCIVAFATSGIYVPAAAQNALAAYSFDAGSGTVLSDVSGQNNTINLQNGPVWSSGRFGGALSFDGTNDLGVAAASNPALNLAGRSFTLSAWINPRTNSGWQMIINKPYGSSHRTPYFDWSMHRERSTGRLAVFLGCDRRQLTSNAATPINVWTHVAVTYDGSFLRHYINGVLDRTTALSCAVTNTNSRPIRIAANGGGGEVMNGLIDDVRVYAAPLTAAQIQADMGSPLGGGSADGSAPTVSVTSPLNGASVSGTVNINATASDNVGVTGVQFKVDGISRGAEDLSAPFTVAWNTAQESNGAHALTATARDAAGNTRTSSVVSVSVNNGGVAPTVSLTADPTSTPSGGSSLLTWSSANASSCAASGAWAGSKPTSGSQSTGGLATTSTFTLTCTGPGGSASRSATVTVASGVPAPTVNLSASPTSVPSGGSANLTWSSSNANSCASSGAWSGSRPTAGSAATPQLTAPENTFTLACTGTGGTTSRSVIVRVTGSEGLLGLDFQGSASTSATVRFRFTNPLAIYPATYIWKVRPRHQLGYYTTFFWGNDGAFEWSDCKPYCADTFYGAHPYPQWGSSGATHKWEIAARAQDYLSAENVVYDVWYTQALRVWSDSSGKHHEFYWDLPNTARVIRVDLPTSYGNRMPPSPALTFGDAPWAPSREMMNGIIRGIQIYSSTLTLTEILNEIADPLATSKGASSVWYMNLNPTPSDISDKSGRGHNPAWVGSERPRLWSGN